MNKKNLKTEYDYIIIGSGFGGAVSAYRLSQKGYKVLVIEKGQWYSDGTFAKNAWNLRRWLWMPMLGLRGIMKMSILKHVTVYSGVGVGGGSLVYGATLPTPKSAFFKTGSWSSLQDWETVLKPHYQEALRMLGAQDNPHFTDADIVIEDLAKELGKEPDFHASRVGIFFSDKKERGQFVPDPYFGGRGPARRGCIECGSCMTGCRYNAKNSLDKNYLFLAQKLGADILAETEVTDVIPVGKQDGSEGYFVSCKSSKGLSSKSHVLMTQGVVFSGGVLGTVPLLLKLKETGSLALLSDKLGEDIRTNNETVTSVTSFKNNVNYANGVCIGSVLHTDENSHLEPINYNNRSGFLKFLAAPKVEGDTFLARSVSFFKTMLTHPVNNLRVLFTRDWGKKTVMLLFMQTIDSTLSLKRGLGGLTNTSLGKGSAPSRKIEASEALTTKVERIMGGKAASSMMEAVLGTPTTAHILGGAVMGASASEGVINDRGEVFGYHNLFVCDGSAVSANPGVNPSLSITAITEWNMSHIAQRANPADNINAHRLIEGVPNPKVPLSESA